MSQSSKTNREFRNLANLSESASTCRVLNLAQIGLRHRNDEDYREKPFFKTHGLNRAVIVKHTLRVHEMSAFDTPRRTVTKVILPFEPSDLRLGGSSFFVNQKHYKSLMQNVLNVNDVENDPDYRLLKLIDTIPSLDPFFVRELLVRHGYKPAQCYLKISASDISKMLQFVNREIELLVKMAMGNASNGAAMKLAVKILSNETDDDLLPLKLTLRLSESEFAEGIFCWRGFLYFKWRLLELQNELNQVLKGLATYTPLGKADPSISQYLDKVRPIIAKEILGTLNRVSRLIGQYDQAYGVLISQGKPTEFRNFLLNGPKLFHDLGESVAILSHVSSFWNYRMVNKHGQPNKLTPDDYCDMLIDFEENLSQLAVMA